MLERKYKEHLAEWLKHGGTQGTIIITIMGVVDLKLGKREE